MCSKEKLIKKYANIEKEKLHIIEELQKIENGLIVDDSVDSPSGIVFILSCPGEQELIKQRPCVGKTGKNIVAIMNKIEQLDKNKQLIVKYDNTYNYINASNKVHFREFDTAEASNAEIRDEKNVKRVEKSLLKINGLKYIIICGKKAQLLKKNIEDEKKFQQVKIAETCHLGDVGLRNTYTSESVVDGKKIRDYLKNERDDKRYELVAQTILDQLTAK